MNRPGPHDRHRGAYTREIYERIMTPMINRGEVVGFVSAPRQCIIYVVRPRER